MQNQDWINLFQLIPAAQHNTLVVTTQTGVELAIEVILRTEPNFMVIRGRQVGQTDDGRAFFVPYDIITFININRMMKEDEILALFAGEPDAQSGWSSNEDESAIIPPPPMSSGAPMPIATPRGSGFMPRVPPPAVTAFKLPSAAPTARPAPPLPTEGTVAKGSILERLRAQRNTMKGPPR